MTIKNLIQFFKTFTTEHPILQTFSWGNLSDYSREDYITQYPAIHFVPQPSTLGDTSQDITFSVLIYDLLNEYVDNPTNSNQLDSMALCEEIMGDFTNYFINQLTNYGYYLQTPISYSYFTDRFAESVCGVEATITITIEQTACIPPFIVPCPTETIQQYLTTTITGDTIVLDLFSDSGTTSGTTALCNYSYSGMAGGSSGSTYYFTGFIQEGQSSKTIDTSGNFLYSGETMVSGGILDITTTGCDCPTNINFTDFDPVGSYSLEYAQVIGRGISNGNDLPSYQKQSEQNNFVVELKTEGYWDLLRTFYLWNGDYTELGFDSIEWKTGNNNAQFRQSNLGTNPPTHDAGKGIHFNLGWDIQLANNLNNDENGVHFGVWVYDNLDTTPDTYEKWYIGSGSLPPRQGMSARSASGSHRWPSLTAVPVASSADMSGSGFRMMGNSGNTATNGVITFTRDTDELYYNGLTYSPTFIRLAPRINFTSGTGQPGFEWICSAYWNTNRGLDENERNGLRTLLQKYLTTA